MDKQEIQKFIEKATVPISASMLRINVLPKKVLFLVDDRGCLLGTLTDGDIRRYILSGGKIEDMSLRAANRNPIVAKSLEDAARLHREMYLAIPILDEARMIVDIYTGEGRINKIYGKLGIPVVINAGGKGTRLEPFTRVLPKPLIPVGELPIIELIMQEYQKYECSDFHIIVNYKRELLKAYFTDREKQYNITWYDEKKPLGTGGGLGLLKGKFDSTFFFANCDTLLTSNYEKILQFHRNNKNVITVICAYQDVTIPYGIVEIDTNGSIKNMKEKPLLPVLINTGIYIVEPEVIDDFGDDVAVGFPDIIEEERKKGKKVAAFPINKEEWTDMGQLPQLNNMIIKLYNK